MNIQITKVLSIIEYMIPFCVHYLLLMQKLLITSIPFVLAENHCIPPPQSDLLISLHPAVSNNCHHYTPLICSHSIIRYNQCNQSNGPCMVTPGQMAGQGILQHRNLKLYCIVIRNSSLIKMLTEVQIHCEQACVTPYRLLMIYSSTAELQVFDCTRLR